MSRLTLLDTPIFYQGAVAAFAVVYFGEPSTDPTAVDGLGAYTNEKTPYTDRALSTATTAQITLDQYGKFPNRLFLSGSYSITAKTAGGVQIFAFASYEGESTDTLGDDSDYAGANLTATLNAIKTTTDALTNTAIINLIYPVGHVISTYISTNPGTTFGIGTWVSIGTGSVIGAVGSKDDQNAVNNVLALGDNAGEWEHTLTEAQTPEHAHNLFGNAIQAAGNPDISSGSDVVAKEFDNSGNNDQYIMKKAAASATSATLGASSSFGGADAFGVKNPTYALYWWRRTA